MTRLSLLPMLALLTACATPQERCQRDATAALRAHQNLIASTQANVARGYAVHRQSVPYTYQGVCYDRDIRYSCPRTGTRTEETPVAIDVAEERAKLKRLTAETGALQRRSQEALKNCAFVAG